MTVYDHFRPPALDIFCQDDIPARQIIFFLHLYFFSYQVVIFWFTNLCFFLFKILPDCCYMLFTLPRGYFGQTNHVAFYIYISFQDLFPNFLVINWSISRTYDILYQVDIRTRQIILCRLHLHFISHPVFKFW